MAKDLLFEIGIQGKPHRLPVHPHGRHAAPHGTHRRGPRGEAGRCRERESRPVRQDRLRCGRQPDEGSAGLCARPARRPEGPRRQGRIRLRGSPRGRPADGQAPRDAAAGARLQPLVPQQYALGRPRLQVHPPDPLVRRALRLRCHPVRARKRQVGPHVARPPLPLSGRLRDR